jgi:intracellular sulfur oxidation DsrE/DsrF family protein
MAAESEATRPEPMKVVFHAPTPGALTRARSNAKNLLRARPDAQVRIVVNADAVAALEDSGDPQTDPMIRVCENTLARQGRAAPPGMATVPAAVVALAELQAEGWAYIRS